jgi:hypothetical protein
MDWWWAGGIALIWACLGAAIVALVVARKWRD